MKFMCLGCTLVTIRSKKLLYMKTPQSRVVREQGGLRLSEIEYGGRGEKWKGVGWGGTRAGVLELAEMRYGGREAG